MIDKPEPTNLSIELTEYGPSKYQHVAMQLCEVLKADAIALVVIGGPLGSGGSSAARTIEAMQQLPSMLRRIAEQQAKQLP